MTSEMAQKMSKSDTNYKLTDPQRSINLKHRKLKENSTKVYYNQIAQNHLKREKS